MLKKASKREYIILLIGEYTKLGIALIIGILVHLIVPNYLIMILAFIVGWAIGLLLQGMYYRRVDI